jgi:hypothetical protein
MTDPGAPLAYALDELGSVGVTVETSTGGTYRATPNGCSAAAGHAKERTEPCPCTG